MIELVEFDFGSGNKWIVNALELAKIILSHQDLELNELGLRRYDNKDGEVLLESDAMELISNDLLFSRKIGWLVSNQRALMRVENHANSKEESSETFAIEVLRAYVNKVKIGVTMFEIV